MEKMKMETTSEFEKNIDKISDLFPSCITETRNKNGQLKKVINFEKLHNLLSPALIEGGGQSLMNLLG